VASGLPEDALRFAGGRHTRLLAQGAAACGIDRWRLRRGATGGQRPHQPAVARLTHGIERQKQSCLGLGDARSAARQCRFDRPLTGTQPDLSQRLALTFDPWAIFTGEESARRDLHRHPRLG